MIKTPPKDHLTFLYSLIILDEKMGALTQNEKIA
jgi:hypothetical protein